MHLLPQVITVFSAFRWFSTSSAAPLERGAVADQAVMGSSQGSSTIYFGYGSNLWLHQMELRCPTSDYLGVARLNGYKWIINDRGYANVVQVNDALNGTTDYDHVVFGLFYRLQPKDEAQLDKNEGVPIAYTKEDIPDIDIWESTDGKWVDVGGKPTSSLPMLVYIDRNRTSEAEPKEEYVYRMNRGIDDAVKMGVPVEYVESVMRKFIPPDEGGSKSMEEKARSQAGRFKDESGVF